MTIVAKSSLHNIIVFFTDLSVVVGCCDASRESISYLLTRPDTGYALILVIGGAEEALEAHPGEYSIILSKRKGFVKLAIKYG